MHCAISEKKTSMLFLKAKKIHSNLKESPKLPCQTNARQIIFYCTKKHILGILFCVHHVSNSAGHCVFVGFDAAHCPLCYTFVLKTSGLSLYTAECWLCRKLLSFHHAEILWGKRSLVDERLMQAFPFIFITGDNYI